MIYTDQYGDPVFVSYLHLDPEKIVVVSRNLDTDSTRIEYQGDTDDWEVSTNEAGHQEIVNFVQNVHSQLPPHVALNKNAAQHLPPTRAIKLEDE